MQVNFFQRGAIGGSGCRRGIVSFQLPVTVVSGPCPGMCYWWFTNGRRRLPVGVPGQSMGTRENGQVATRGELSDREPTVMPGSVSFLLLEFVEIGLYFFRFETFQPIFRTKPREYFFRFETFQPIFRIKVPEMGLDIVFPEFFHGV